MQNNDPISRFTDDLATGLRKELADLVAAIPSPASGLIERLGLVGVEFVRQYGRITQASVSALEEVIRVLATGVSNIGEEIEDAAETALEAARTAGKDVSDAVGRQFSVVEDAAEDVADKVSDAAGKVLASARRNADAVVRETDRAANDTFGVGGDLDDLTKDELYAKAQDLDIDGRSTMSKDELVDALRSA